MATQTQPSDTSMESDDFTDEQLADALMQTMTAEQLRRFAAHLDDVSRRRGANKADTARAVVEQDRDAALANLTGSFRVECTGCELAFWTDHPQTALKAAKSHKAGNNSHFPAAIDADTDDRIYG